MNRVLFSLEIDNLDLPRWGFFRWPPAYWNRSMVKFFKDYVSLKIRVLEIRILSVVWCTDRAGCRFLCSYEVE